MNFQLKLQLIIKTLSIHGKSSPKNTRSYGKQGHNKNRNINHIYILTSWKIYKDIER